MKVKKSFLALLVAVITILSVGGTTVFATEMETDYNENLPEDAVIVYQGEDGIIYQSKTSPSETATNENAVATAALVYSGHSVTASKGETSKYYIDNPYSGTCYGTFKVTETSSDLYAHMLIIAPSGRNVGGVIRPHMGDVYFTLYNGAGRCTIEYSVEGPAHLNCWLYQTKPADYYDRIYLND